jgi:signal transduction histidine kinase
MTSNNKEKHLEGPDKPLQTLLALSEDFYNCFYDIINAIPDFIFVMDKDGNYIDFKKGIGEIYQQESFIYNSNIRDHNFPEDFVAELLYHITYPIETGKMHYFNYDLPFPNGIVRSYTSRSIKINAQYSMRIVRDVTDIQNNVKLLHQRNKELMHQSTQLRQYAYLVSHNLRSPITNMLGIIDLIKDGLVSDEELNEMMGILYKEVSKLDVISREMNKVLKANENEQAFKIY